MRRMISLTDRSRSDDPFTGPHKQPRLDAFEGPGYERVVTTVHTPTGDVDASIYVLVEIQGR